MFERLGFASTMERVATDLLHQLQDFQGGTGISRHPVGKVFEECGLNAELPPGPLSAAIPRWSSPSLFPRGRCGARPANAGRSEASATDEPSPAAPPTHRPAPRLQTRDRDPSRPPVLAAK